MSALAGKRVLVTRPRDQAAPLVEKLVALGAYPIVFPTIEIATQGDTGRLDRAIHELSAYAWVIFTSANGVLTFWERLAALGKTARVFEGARVAAIGPATAQALEDRGLSPDFVPQEHVAEAIAPGLGDVRGKRILLPRAEIARKALFDELERRGAQPDEIAVYRTLAPEPDPQALAELERGVDVATFTSSSTVKNFFELLGPRAAGLLNGATVACIGPVTAQTAREHGLSVDVVAEEYTIDGLVEALVVYLEGTRTSAE